MATPAVNPVLEKAKQTQGASTQLPTNPKLAAVEEALQVSAKRTSENVTSLEEGARRTKEATDVLTSALDAATSANQIIAATRDAAALQAQNATIEAAGEVATTEYQKQLMKMLQQDQQRVQQLIAERQDIVDNEYTGVQLIDGIIGQLATVQTNLEIGAARQKLNSTERQIQGVTAATESFAKINALTGKTLNKASIKANYDLIAAQAAAKSAEFEIQNINSNAGALTKVMEADSRNASTLLSLYRIEGEEQDRQLKQERAAFAREEMAFQREQWLRAGPAAAVALEQAQLNLANSKKLSPTQIAQAEFNLAKAQEESEKQKQLEQQIVTAVQKGQAMTGLPVEEAQTIIFGFSKDKEKYGLLQELGGDPNAVLGLTPFEAGLNIEKVAPSGNIVETPALKTLQRIVDIQSNIYSKAPKGAPRDQETLKADFNATAANYMAEKASNIVHGDSTNPYQAPPFTVLEQNKAVRESLLYKRVLKAAGLKEANAQTITDLAVAAVRAGSLSPEAASKGIADIFSTAALYNNTHMGGFRRVGLPNQTSYLTTIQRPPTSVERLKLGAASVGPFGFLNPLTSVAAKAAGAALDPTFTKPLIVDFMDEVKVKAALVTMLSASTPPSQ